jgi:hypothetical protein
MTDDAIPVPQRFVVGVEENICPCEDPQTPAIGAGTGQTQRSPLLIYSTCHDVHIQPSRSLQIVQLVTSGITPSEAQSDQFVTGVVTLS